MANYPLEQTPVEEPLRRETVSYLFTLGLSFGYFVARKYIQKESGEEVNNENGESNDTTTQSDNQ